MKFGCHLPMFGPVGNRDGLLGFARRMEALGYDSLWASDHVIVPHRIESKYPYSKTGAFPLPPEAGFLEPLTALAMVAAVTERVAIGTTVLVLPHRHPVLAAKSLATLDHLSNGRVILGAGVGWMREEIELLGAPYEQRGAWSDEAIAVMRACWRDQRTSHRGRFFSVDDVGVFPKPARGDIPVWIGGHTPRALKRVAELADGWHAAFTAPDVMAHDLDLLREECQRQGRAFGELTVSLRLGLSLRRDPLGHDRRPGQGSAEQVLGDLKRYADLGVSTVLLESRARDLDDMLDIFETFARDVRPAV